MLEVNDRFIAFPMKVVEVVSWGWRNGANRAILPLRLLSAVYLVLVTESRAEMG